MLDAARPAAILIAGDVPDADQAALADLVKTGQRQNLAVLVGDNPALAGRIGADGVHVAGGAEAVAAARAELGADALIGAAAPLSRHEAMLAGESGADYVAFDAAGADFEALAEMVGWWAELFEVPCAVWTGPETGDAEIRRLVEAGADYIAPECGPDTDIETLKRLSGLLP